MADATAPAPSSSGSLLRAACVFLALAALVSELVAPHLASGIASVAARHSAGSSMMNSSAGSPPFDLARILCHPVAVPTVAYVFSGLPRTFAAPKVHLSFLRNVVNAFGARPVFFFYFKTSSIEYGDEYVMNGAPDELRLSNATRAEIERALEHFSPRVVVWEEEVDVRDQLRECAKENGKTYWRWVSQWFAQHKALALMRDYEQRLGSKFDWVMWLRPDLVWYYGIKPYCGFDRNIFYDPNTFGSSVPYPDWFGFVRGDIAVAALDRLHNIGSECNIVDNVAALKSQKLIVATNLETGANFMPGYAVRQCNYGNLQECCSYMIDKRYFANRDSGECDRLLHAC